MEILGSLQSEERAVVIVTHDTGIANSAARKVSMLDGRIVSDEVLR
jgi:ABC-type lipoprotein export system ATPase subunit